MKTVKYILGHITDYENVELTESQIQEIEDSITPGLCSPDENIEKHINMYLMNHGYIYGEYSWLK